MKRCTIYNFVNCSFCLEPYPHYLLEYDGALSYEYSIFYIFFSLRKMSVFCYIAASPSLFFFKRSPSVCPSPLFSVSSLVAVPCWGESNLNCSSQGPIPLLPAVGISGLLISYQPVIGLQSPSPSDIPQIYDTPDSLRGGWGGRGEPPACQHFTQQNVFLTA